MNRVFGYAIAGLLGAFAGWFILEPTPLMPNGSGSISPLGSIIVGLVIGGLIGLCIGYLSSRGGFSNRDRVKIFLAGILVGAGGGIVGLTLGNIIWAPFAAMETNAATPLRFLALIFGRSVGWALIGLFVGLSQGIAVMSNRKMVSGAVGGFIGGGLGGLIFQLMAFSGIFSPPIVRFVSFSIMGFAVGLFIGIAAEVTKKAWLLREVGRGEGKEYELFREVTLLGRDELADVPVYGDNRVGKKHAQIYVENNQYFIQDLGSGVTTTVNGSAVTKHQLKDGDIIHLGTIRFVFKTKSKGYSKTTGASFAERYVPPTAVDSAICPFCGEAKDANGNCACSVIPPPTSVADKTVLEQTNNMQHPSPAHDSLVTAKLTGVSGPYASVQFELNGMQSIGRATDANISLQNDTTISRNHAKILFDSSKWYIEDTGSANGTIVNEEKITRRELAIGDIIKIGKSSFRFDI